MRRLLSVLWFGPADWLVNNTNARQRLAAAIWMTLFWMPPFPGFWLWLLWIHAVWMLGVISIATVWMTGLTMAGTETPSKVEKG